MGAAESRQHLLSLCCCNWRAPASSARPLSSRFIAIICFWCSSRCSSFACWSSQQGTVFGAVSKPLCWTHTLAIRVRSEARFHLCKPSLRAHRTQPISSAPTRAPVAPTSAPGAPTEILPGAACGGWCRRDREGDLTVARCSRLAAAGDELSFFICLMISIASSDIRPDER